MKKLSDIQDRIRWEKYFDPNFVWQSRNAKLYLNDIKTLDVSFLRLFKDKLKWHVVSIWRDMSEEEIREFADYVDWDSILTYQTVSESFLKEFEAKLPDWVFKDFLESGLKSPNISDELKEELIKIRKLRERK